MTWDNVTVFGHRGVRVCEFQNLGKINVICGRNNSGKTTILEALADRNHHSFGGRPSIDAIVRGLSKGGFDVVYVTPPTDFLEDLIKTVLASKEIWYGNEARDFARSVLQNLETRRNELPPPIDARPYGMTEVSLAGAFVAGIRKNTPDTQSSRQIS